MPHDWLALLRDLTAGFAGVLEHADLDAPVTYCPDWSVRDLTIHLGGVHRWAAHAVTAGNPDLEPVTHVSDDELTGWYRRCAAHLVDVLAATPPDGPAWTLDESDRTAGFWRRRQVHETAVHLWDMEEALGEPRPIDPALAWDGVLEVAEVMYPRQVRLGRIEPLPTALRLVAADVDGEVTLGGGASVVVRDRAEVLLRLLWHRADHSGLDPRAARVLATAVTP